MCGSEQYIFLEKMELKRVRPRVMLPYHHSPEQLLFWQLFLAWGRVFVSTKIFMTEDQHY